MSETMVGDAAVRDRGKWLCRMIVGSDLLSLPLVFSLCRWQDVGHGCLLWLRVRLALLYLTIQTIYIRVAHADYPDVLWRLSGCLRSASVVCSSLDRRSWNVVCLFLRGPDRITAPCISLGESGWWWSGW